MNFSQYINTVKQQNLHRSHKTITHIDGVNIIINNKKLFNFCSNDYLGLSQNDDVKSAFKLGIDKFGSGGTSSHLISGHSIAHQQLEQTLADFVGCEKTLLFSTGYMANLGVFSALKDNIDWVLQDKLNHASLIDGNTLISLPIKRYKHNNIQSLQQKIIKMQGVGLIATDNVFSMDGDFAKINQINNVISGNLLFQDDAHGFGIYQAIIPKNSIYMATFGKAVGTNGAFVAGNADLIDYLVQKSRTYIYTTAIPAATCYATLKSLEIIQQNTLQDKLFANIKLFKNLINTISNTAIQPIVVKDNYSAIMICEYLFDNGFFVTAVRSPTVKTPRLRITISASHSSEQIIQLTGKLNIALTKFN